jgi:hypothetical protein
MAAAFIEAMDPTRFGIIAHVNGDADVLNPWVVACGTRLRHLHLQLREPEQASPEARARLTGCIALLRSHNYRGSASVEFTRGIGPAEHIEAIYAQAVADLRAYREAWS